MVQQVTSATWSKQADDWIRVSLKFHYGDRKEGLIEINFIDQNFRDGWFRSYRESGIGLYGYDGSWGGELQDKVRGFFKGGIDVRQDTVDAFSFIAGQVRRKFDEKIIGNSFFGNEWRIIEVTNVAYRYEDGCLKMRLSFSYSDDGSSYRSQGYIDLYFTKEGGDHGGLQGWKVTFWGLPGLSWRGILSERSSVLYDRLHNRVKELYGSFQVQVPVPPPATAPATSVGAAGQLAPGGDHGQRPTGAPQGDPAPRAPAVTEAADEVAVANHERQDTLTANQERPDTAATDALFADPWHSRREGA
jgi:hypothetical protein